MIQPLQRTVWRFLKSLKIELPELPCWSSGKESASEGSRRRFSPQSRKVPRAVGQPSLGSTATEAHAPTACARQQEEPPQEEASWHPEKGHRQQRKYSTAKNKQKTVKKQNHHAAQKSHSWDIPRESHISKRYVCPKFVAALFTIARTWKQPRCPSTEDWMKTWYIHTMECYAAIKRNKTGSFAMHGWT